MECTNVSGATQLPVDCPAKWTWSRGSKRERIAERMLSVIAESYIKNASAGLEILRLRQELPSD